MRPVPAVAAVAVTLALVAGCTDTAGNPTSVDTRPRGPVASASLTAGVTQLQRLRLDLAGWVDARTIVPLEVLTPEAAANIGPGSAIVMTIPDEGRFGCTANFIWRSGGRRYLGAAGHCFLAATATSTHGPDADYDASGVVVQVCVEDCEGNFRTNLLLGRWVTLGRVAYARQTAGGEDVGNDFGVVEIPRKIEEVLRRSLPVWGGPTGVDQLQLGATACHYGHGLGFGEVYPTKARVGVGGGSDDQAWMGDFAGAFGDSGSPLVACEQTGATFEGRGAIGVLTHLGIGVDESTGEHGVIFGTTIARAIEMGQEAGLRLTLLLQ